MQQLISKLELLDSCIMLTPVDVINYDNFTEFPDRFLGKLTDASLLEVSQGADRHQYHFRWGQFDFLLQYEEYSDAIWIEAVIDASDSLPKLHDCLVNQLG